MILQNIIIGQRELFELYLNHEFYNNAHLHIIINNYMSRGISYNCRIEGKTIIENWAINKLEFAQILLNKFDTLILDDQIVKEVDVILLNISKEICPRDELNHNNAIQILAGQKLLKKAIEDDNPIMLKKLLHYGVNFTNSDYMTAFGECRQILIDQRILNNDLFYLRGDVKQIKFLLNAGAQIQCIEGLSNSADCNILTKVIKEKSFSVVATLINNMRIHYVDKNGNSLLHLLISCINEHLLGEINLSKNSITKIKLTVFGKTKSKLIETLKKLLREKANLNHQNNEGNTPLHLAVKSLNGRPIVKKLLKANADPTILNLNFFSPLHIAINYGHNEIVQDLTNKLTETNLYPDNDGILYLNHAI